MHPNPDTGDNLPGSVVREINWEERCTHLEHQLSVLKEVSAMRKSLIELRESESKALIVKLKLLEEAVAEEKKYRTGVMKRLELAELECIQLKGSLNRNLETLERMKTYHEGQQAVSVNNLEACELKLKQCTVELEETSQKNCQIEVSARWPGSVHDSRVFRNSPVYYRFEEGWRPFAGAVILGDSGYRRRNWLMTPYASNGGDVAEARFNRAHKRTRRLVENSFGILKERFPCLNKMRLNPEYTGRIVMACAALHNITTTEDFMVDGIAEENEDAVEIEPQPENNQRLNELLSFFR